MIKANDELIYKMFKSIDANSAADQRHITALILGKLKYCLKALLNKGLAKAENFTVSQQQTQLSLQTHPRRNNCKGCCHASFSQIENK